MAYLRVHFVGLSIFLPTRVKRIWFTGKCSVTHVQTKFIVYVMCDSVSVHMYILCLNESRIQHIALTLTTLVLLG